MRINISSLGVPIIIFVISSCGLPKTIRKNLVQYSKEDYSRDLTLIKSFSKVDSIVKKNKYGTSYYCPGGVLSEMRVKTGISSTGGGSIIGPQFTIDDWVKWHEWFKDNFRK